MSSSIRLDDLQQKYAENPRRYFAPLANELRKSGDARAAIALCREHLAQQPGHMSGHVVLAQAHFDVGELDEARRIFDEALELDPENLVALRYLGDIAQEHGTPDDARRWYQRILEIDPRDPEAHARLETLAAQAAPPTVPEASPAPFASVAPPEAPVAPMTAFVAPAFEPEPPDAYAPERVPDDVPQDVSPDALHEYTPMAADAASLAPEGEEADTRAFDEMLASLPEAERDVGALGPELDDAAEPWGEPAFVRDAETTASFAAEPADAGDPDTLLRELEGQFGAEEFTAGFFAEVLDPAALGDARDEQGGAPSAAADEPAVESPSEAVGEEELDLADRGEVEEPWPEAAAEQGWDGASAAEVVGAGEAPWELVSPDASFDQAGVEDSVAELAADYELTSEMPPDESAAQSAPDDTPASWVEAEPPAEPSSAPEVPAESSGSVESMDEAGHQPTLAELDAWGAEAPAAAAAEPPEAELPREEAVEPEEAVEAEEAAQWLDAAAADEPLPQDFAPIPAPATEVGEADWFADTVEYPAPAAEPSPVDLAGAVAPAAGDDAGMSAGQPSAEQPSVEQVPVEERPTAAAPADAFATATMAELYERQGLHERALGVYRQLLERDPSDPELESEVARLERLLSGEPAATAEGASGAAERGIEVPPTVAGWLRALVTTPPPRAETIVPVAGEAAPAPEATDEPRAGWSAAGSSPNPSMSLDELLGGPVRPAEEHAAGALVAATLSLQSDADVDAQLAELTQDDPASLERVLAEPTPPSPTAPPRQGMSFSFEQFFRPSPEAPAPPGGEVAATQAGEAPDRAAPAPDRSVDADLEDFHAWLAGLSKS